MMRAGPKEKNSRVQTTKGYLLSTGISDYGKSGLICGQGNVPPPPPKRLRDLQHYNLPVGMQALCSIIPQNMKSLDSEAQRVITIKFLPTISQHDPTHTA